MKELRECIKQNSVTNVQEIEHCITNMVCSKKDPIPLDETSLVEALEIEGEFFVLKLHYDDFQTELESQKIKYKISQALSVIVCYEDDGKSFHKVDKFVKYIYDISDVKQNSTFGVKNVKELSEFPITILFSGILPINQLKITVGKAIDGLIHSNDEYYIPRFAKHRDDISQEVRIPILPVFPLLDEGLNDYQVHLIDLVDDRVISDFQVKEKLDEDAVEEALLKLFYIYKVLIEEKQQLAQ